MKSRSSVTGVTAFQKPPSVKERAKSRGCDRCDRFSETPPSSETSKKQGGVTTFQKPPRVLKRDMRPGCDRCDRFSETPPSNEMSKKQGGVTGVTGFQKPPQVQKRARNFNEFNESIRGCDQCDRGVTGKWSHLSSIISMSYIYCDQCDHFSLTPRNVFRNVHVRNIVKTPFIRGGVSENRSHRSHQGKAFEIIR